MVLQKAHMSLLSETQFLLRFFQIHSEMSTNDWLEELEVKNDRKEE